MKVLYDHQTFLVQKYGGISKYFCELIKNLPKSYQFNLSVLISDNQYLKEQNNIFKKAHLPIPEKDFKGKWLAKRMLYKINRRYSEYNISSNKFDLLHPTYYDPYFLKNLKKPYIITVHDLIDFKYKELYKGKSMMPQMELIIKNANRLIAISQNTKRDIIEIFNINPDKIDVIYHGYNESITKKKNHFGRYILYVGRREGYKNFTKFARAASILMKRERDIKLVCVGKPFDNDEISELKQLQIWQKTIALDVNEKRLNEIYSSALVFVYPSLYEGFGMPILEAFTNNCPICLSNTSSLPEIAGNAGVYFDPNDQDSILQAIESVIFNEELSQNIIEAGRIRLKEFSWEKCTMSTISSYEKTLS